MYDGVVLRVTKDEGAFSSHAFHESVLADLLDVSVDTVRTADNLFDIVSINRDEYVTRIDCGRAEQPFRNRQVGKGIKSRFVNELDRAA